MAARVALRQIHSSQEGFNINRETQKGLAESMYEEAVYYFQLEPCRPFVLQLEEGVTDSLGMKMRVKPRAHLVQDGPLLRVADSLACDMTRFVPLGTSRGRKDQRERIQRVDMFGCPNQSGGAIPTTHV